MQGTLNISMQELDYAIQHERDMEVLRISTNRTRRRDNGFRCSKSYGELLDLVSLCSKVYGYIQSPLDNIRDQEKARRAIENKKSKEKNIKRRAENYKIKQAKIIEAIQTNYDKSDGWASRRAKRAKSTPSKKQSVCIEYNETIEVISPYGVTFSIPKVKFR